LPGIGGAAGPNIGHLPEVGLVSHPVDAGGVNAHCFCPQLIGFVVAGVNGVDQALRSQTVAFYQQVVGKLDGSLFEIVAKREVAQHLKEGVVSRRRTDVFQVVVFSGHAHTFLRSDGAKIIPLFKAQKGVLELHHSGVGKEERRVAAGDQGIAGDDGVAVFFKEIKKCLANFGAALWLGHSEPLVD